MHNKFSVTIFDLAIDIKFFLICKENLKIPYIEEEHNTIAKRKRTKRQTMINKTHI